MCYTAKILLKFVDCTFKAYYLNKILICFSHDVFINCCKPNIKYHVRHFFLVFYIQATIFTIRFK